ncbi:hypothetical protein CBR_g30191 [Chara braunii]|uniref:CCHC-type domain-containing protein n=1 Tax=Chara braunii TaxID=69332 RepID=A0A388LCA8_CHABU|nr:hypothetical protein CBR_g30191 [Chara braunii]|eukprot:GBG79926.1 hypothetical protein CBR_g30191 [Chara braunii]
MISLNRELRTLTYLEIAYWGGVSVFSLHCATCYFFTLTCNLLLFGSAASIRVVGHLGVGLHEMSSTDHREGYLGHDGGGDRRPQRGPTCFNCGEVGHYANQCPNRRRYLGPARPSTSTDSRRSRSPRRYEPRREQHVPQLDPGSKAQIAKLAWSLATMKEHFDEEISNKKEKERKKREREEAKQRKEEEKRREEEKKARLERKANKKKEKQRLEESRRAEMKKDLNIHMAIRLSEMEDRFVDRVRQAVDAVNMLQKEKGKLPVTLESGEESASDYKNRKEDRQVVGILQKEDVGQDSAKGTTTVSRKTPPEALTPTSEGSLARLCYRNFVMMELKSLDATELQKICREEGIAYDKKIDAIFDIVDHRAAIKYGHGDVVATEVIRITESGDSGETGETAEAAKDTKP